MGWGNISNITTTHLDSASDDPSQARVELYNALVELQAVVNGRAAADGVAPLNGSTKITASYLPNTIGSDSGLDLTLAPDTTRVTLQNILNLTPRTVSQLQAVTASAGDIAYCSNGDAGSPCLAISKGESDSQGSVWYRIALGTEISAT